MNSSDFSNQMDALIASFVAYEQEHIKTHAASVSTQDTQTDCATLAPIHIDNETQTNKRKTTASKECKEIAKLFKKMAV